MRSLPENRFFGGLLRYFMLKPGLTVSLAGTFVATYSNRVGMSTPHTSSGSPRLITLPFYLSVRHPLAHLSLDLCRCRTLILIRDPGTNTGRGQGRGEQGDPFVPRKNAEVHNTKHGVSTRNNEWRALMYHFLFKTDSCKQECLLHYPINSSGQREIRVRIDLRGHENNRPLTSESTGSLYVHSHNANWSSGNSRPVHAPCRGCFQGSCLIMVRLRQVSLTHRIVP